MKTAGKTFPVSSTATDPTTGQTYTSFYDVFTIGAGYLDVAAALSNHDETFLSSVSPSAAYSPVSEQGYFVLPLNSNWSWLPQWSTSAVWGNTALPNGSNIWNSSYVWGSSGSWGTSIAWGTSGPSDTSIAWGTSGQGEP
jgi:serine protease AprX